MIGESLQSTGTRLCCADPCPPIWNVSLHLCFPPKLTWRRKPCHWKQDETGNLIGSDKVEGTAVYGADSNKIGSIERVMIDKMSGRVSYAVLSFGGFLGIGDDHYPLPWQSLKYDTTLGGYVTGVTENAAQGRAAIRQRQCLELGRPDPDPRRQRLLRRRDLIALTPDVDRARLDGGPYCE